MSYNYYSTISLLNNPDINIFADDDAAHIEVRNLHIFISKRGSYLYGKSNIDIPDKAEPGFYENALMLETVENFYFRTVYLKANPDGFELTKDQSDYLCDNIETLVKRFMTEKESHIVRVFLKSNHIDLNKIESDPLSYVDAARTGTGKVIDLFAIQYYARSLV